LKKHDDKSMLAKRLEMLPITFHIWNVAQVLEYPVIEMTLKISNRSEMDQMTRIATKVNAVLKSYFQRRRLMLGDIRLEFGRAGNAIFLGDEVSPDTFVLYELDDKGQVANPDKFQIKGSKKLDVYQAYYDLFFNK